MELLSKLLMKTDSALQGRLVSSIILIIMSTILLSACSGSPKSDPPEQTEEPLVVEPTDPTELLDPDSKVPVTSPGPLTAVTVKYGIDVSAMPITVTHLNNYSRLAVLSLLKSLEINSFTFRLEEDLHKIRVEGMIQDFSECGFSYDGPNCLELQRKSARSHGIVDVGGELYVYTQFVYSETFTQNFFLFIPIQDFGEMTAGENDKAFLYLVVDENFEHDLVNLLSEKSGLCVASIRFKQLKPGEFLEGEYSGDNLREKLGTMLKKIYVSESLKVSELELRILASAQQLVNETKEAVIEADDPQISFLWLAIQQKIMESDVFLRFLKAILETSSSPKLSREAGLFLLSLGISDSAVDDEFAGALLDESSPAQRRAIWLAEVQQSLSEKVLLILITILNYEDIDIATMAYNILDKSVLKSDYVNKLAKMTHGLGRNNHTFFFALNLLAKIDEVDSHNAIIRELSNKNNDIRSLAATIVDTLKLHPESAAVIKGELSSSYVNSKELAVDLLDRIDTSEATYYLIDHLNKAYSLQQEKILEVLEKSSKQFSDEHIPLFQKYLYVDNERIRRKTVDYTFRLGSELAVKEILTWVFNDPFSDLKSSEFEGTFVPQLRNIQSYPSHAELLAKGFSLKNKLIRDAFVDHLLNLRHFNATHQLLYKIWPLPSDVEPYLEAILRNLKERGESGDISLFDGNVALDLRYIIVSTLSYVNSLYEDLKDPEKRSAAESRLDQVPVINSMNSLAHQLLLPLRTEAALEAMIELADYPEFDLRQRYIQSVLSFSRFPRKFSSLLFFHLIKAPGGHYPPHNSAGNVLYYGPSEYPETRKLAFTVLKWMIENTRDERSELEVSVGADHVLNYFYYIISRPIESEYLKPELDSTIIDEAKSFIKSFFADVPKEEIPENFIRNFRNHIASESKTRCETIVPPEKFYKYFNSLEMLAFFENPQIAVWFRDFLTECSQYPKNNPEITAAIRKTIEKIEGRLLIQ